VYTSSVAAYGYHLDNPVPLTEHTLPRGSIEHYYSEQKAVCETVLAEVTDGTALEVFVLRPCMVAGPKATAVADAMPWNRLPAKVRSVTAAVPLLKVVCPDPGIPLQLVHHDDVADAIALAATTSAAAGAYNIAADGEITLTDIANALGARPVKVPAAAATIASAVVARLPFLPSALEWLHFGKTSIVMDTKKAKAELGWKPRYTSAETLESLAASL
ncbi:MAG: NAD-dependent epimerase/dehydratase family protein, partial [Mycobacterium sp.]